MEREGDWAFKKLSLTVISLNWTQGLDQKPVRKSMGTVKFGVTSLAVVIIGLSGCDRDDPIPTPEQVTKNPLKEVDKIIAEVEGVRRKDPVKVVETAEPNAPAEEKKSPEIPLALPVKDKPGFVISPYNGKWIDVTGMPEGELVADPGFPAEAKKFLRVPALPAAPKDLETPIVPPPTTNPGPPESRKNPPVSPSPIDDSQPVMDDQNGAQPSAQRQLKRSRQGRFV